jgi:carbamoylphosphate synthase large subunit
VGTIKKKILLIGYDSNIGLGVLACLRNQGFQFYLLTHNLKNAARYSRYISKTFYYNANDDSLKDKILQIVKHFQIDFIMPYDELEIRYVTIHKELFSNYATCILGTDAVNFDIGIHKEKLASFLSTNNMPCPSYASLEDKLLIDKLVSKCGFPLLLKPVRMASGRMIRKVYDKASLDKILIENQDQLSNFLLQPFIIGNDVTCNVICKNGIIICYTIQESPVKMGSNFTTNDTLYFHDDPEVQAIVANMMKALHWNGVACIDLRRDAKTRKLYILEINGRFWASVVPSFIKAGVNFPLILLKISLGELVMIPPMKSAIQVSLKQYIHSLLHFGKLKFSDTKYGIYFCDPIARFLQMVS